MMFERRINIVFYKAHRLRVKRRPTQPAPDWRVRKARKDGLFTRQPLTQTVRRLVRHIRYIDRMKSCTQYFLFLLLMPLTIITVGCDASNLAVPSATFIPEMQFLTPTVVSSSMSNELLTQTSQLIPTLDSSTPAPPSGKWVTYTYPESGLSFKYPTNWFILLEEEHNRVRVLNAPPGGNRAIMGAEGGDPEFVKITIYLKPTDIPRLQTFETYVHETINQLNWADEIISVETISALQQGYPAVRVIALGLGERTHYFVENNRHVMQVISDYLPDRRVELASVVEEVVNTLVFP